LLTDRLAWVTSKIMSVPGVGHLPVGYFGSSTGAAPAIKAAVKQNKVVNAIVCRGGRPDLAFDNVSDVRVPVLLVIGSLDGEVLAANRAAYSDLHTIKSLEVVEGASHLFEEPGKLEAVADMSAGWFTKHLIRHLEPSQHVAY
jgi:putative phosphoribosyl transferase